MYQGKRIAVIVAAAGSGTRMGGGVSKLYAELAGTPALGLAVRAFAAHPLVDDIYIVVKEEERQRCEQEIVGAYGGGKVRALVSGGAERQDSVARALKAVCDGRTVADWVLVHDGARPFVTAALIDRVIAGVAAHGTAIPGIPVKDTVKRAEAGLLTETVDRRDLFAIQTPQGFETALLAEAYRKAAAEGFQGTDDAILVERLGHSVHLTEGEERNFKITTPEDLVAARAFITAARPARTGLGFDAHAFAEGRPLILGGVEIPFSRGLVGHSDADVLTHAVIDALLGACALGDIGRHFPDTDPQYKGISSLVLLKHSRDLIEAAGFSVGNIDVTLIGQRPKIAPFAREMAENIAGALGIAPDRVSVKATTTEKMGFTGREEGLAAQAAAVVY